MQLCLNTSAWRERPLQEALDAARAAGLDALDLDAGPGSLHLAPRTGREEALRLESALEGFRVLAVTAHHPDLCRRQEEGGDPAVEQIAAAVKAAKSLGAGVVSTTLGSTEIDAWDTAWERGLSALRWVLRETRRTAMRVAVEVDLGDVLDSLKKARRLLFEIPDARLGLSLDAGHLHYLRIQWSEILEAAGGRVYHVRLRDATRADPSRPLGTGEVSFPGVFRALRRYGYEGPLSLPAEAAGDDPTAAVARLQEWLAPPGG
jgi:sugar phosphate isomerase/epimerase